MSIQDNFGHFMPAITIEDVAGPDEPLRFKWAGYDVEFCPRKRTVTAPLAAADGALQSWLRTIFGDEVLA